MEMIVSDGRRGGGHSVLRRWVNTAVAMFSAAAKVQFRPRLEKVENFLLILIAIRISRNAQAQVLSRDQRV
ncbi:hypothetical protein Hdeb2414_s0008g00279361 [Helianthus debilis subsp. tardiflorus]